MYYCMEIESPAVDNHGIDHKCFAIRQSVEGGHHLDIHEDMSSSRHIVEDSRRT